MSLGDSEYINLTHETMQNCTNMGTLVTLVLLGREGEKRSEGD